MIPGAPYENLCAVHPEVPAVGGCSNCGAFACSACLSLVGSRSICRACIEDGRVNPYALPWESRAELGLFRAWWMTFVALATRPGTFFEGLRAERPLADAWRFAALSVGTVLGLFFGLALALCGIALLTTLLGGGMEDATSNPGSAAVIGALGLLYGFAMSVGPLCSLLFLMAGHHPLMLLVGGGQKGFKATLQVGLYSLGLYPLAVIPCVSMFFVLGILGYQAIGYSKIHEEPVWKSSFAVFLPMCALGMLYVLLLVFTTGMINGLSLQ